MSFATTVEQYVAQQRRVHVVEALEHLVAGDAEGARLRMLTCLALQARVSGIRLEAPDV